MTFTPTKHVRTCRDCGREFVVSREAIELALQDADVATEADARGDRLLHRVRHRRAVPRRAGGMSYQNLIREEAARLGMLGRADPRHVEAWMRVEHDTLDALSPREFAAEVAIAIECAIEAGSETSERLARSLGL